EGSIHSKTLHYEPVKFDRNEDRIEISDVQAAKQLKYVVTAIEVFEQYVRSCNMNLKHFHLTIDSNLADNSVHTDVCAIGPDVLACRALSLT
ncbi:hypothetical protein J8J22_21175, partial [Mycobacterium tuberculosis]|nr:hypothetical protein [Mycobacterium tuberculosis]